MERDTFKILNYNEKEKYIETRIYTHRLKNDKTKSDQKAILLSFRFFFFSFLVLNKSFKNMIFY